MEREEAIRILQSIRVKDDVVLEQCFHMCEQALTLQGAFEQCRRERNVAIEQLRKIGLQLGEDTSNVERKLRICEELNRYYIKLIGGGEYGSEESAE